MLPTLLRIKQIIYNIVVLKKTKSTHSKPCKYIANKIIFSYSYDNNILSK